MQIKGKPTYTKDVELLETVKIILHSSIEFISNNLNFKPTFHLYLNNCSFIYITPWKTIIEERFYFDLIYKECIKHNPNFLIFTADALFSREILSENEQIKISELPPPSQDPERKEALILIIEYPDGKMDSIYTPYDRNILKQPIFNDNSIWVEAYPDTHFIKPWKKKYN